MYSTNVHVHVFTMYIQDCIDNLWCACACILVPYLYVCYVTMYDCLFWCTFNVASCVASVFIFNTSPLIHHNTTVSYYNSFTRSPSPSESSKVANLYRWTSEIERGLSLRPDGYFVCLKVQPCLCQETVSRLHHTIYSIHVH